MYYLFFESESHVSRLVSDLLGSPGQPETFESSNPARLVWQAGTVLSVFWVRRQPSFHVS